MSNIEKIESALADLRFELNNHDLYSQLEEVEDIKTFMEWHIYAVWDFMSLLKALQNQLTCTQVPWRPVSDARVARFINEIVHGEESDLDENGNPASHFEMYLSAMSEVQADFSGIYSLLQKATSKEEVLQALHVGPYPVEVKEFLTFTFEVISGGKAHEIASAFTFGREDVIPDMFLAIINRSENQHRFPKLDYYLKRHIELDGDEHGPLSLEMISMLCGDDPVKWEEVEVIAREALQKRIGLWSGISRAISASKVAEPG